MVSIEVGEIRLQIEYNKFWFSENADKFESWFHPDTFDWEWGFLLASFCPDYFHVWWYCDELRKNDYLFKLCIRERCQEYSHIWGHEKVCRESVFNTLRGDRGYLVVVKI